MNPSGVGELLRRERVSKGLALDEIAKSTKISTRFLKAIEAEDFETLPGLIFTRNFVRQYALFLEMDCNQLVAALPRFDLESAPMPQPPNRSRRRPWDPRWSSALASVAWTFLAGGAAFAAYVHFNRPAHSITTVRAAARPAAEIPATTEITSPALPPSSPPPAEATITPDHPVQVIVSALQESWVQATADGKSVFSGTLKAGETRSIAADEHVKVRTGNAGGIEISLNGKPLDSLGPAGQIRSITLTAGGPQLPSAVPALQNPPTESSPF